MDSSGRKLGGFCILLKDKRGEMISVHDVDGSLFQSESAAQMRVEDAESMHPGYKGRVEPVFEVNFDEETSEDRETEHRLQIPPCPSPVPAEILLPIREAAERWRQSPARPRVEPLVEERWGDLLDRWIADPSVPLFLRKPSLGRGQRLKHDSGRVLIPVDNTPAHWSLSLALVGYCPTLPEIVGFLRNDAIPIAMAMSAAERSAAQWTGVHAQWNGLLSMLGWKVCHVEDVGLRSQKSVEHLRLEVLHEHFRALLSPANMFLMPSVLGGLGELPVVRSMFSRSRHDATGKKMRHD